MAWHVCAARRKARNTQKPDTCTKHNRDAVLNTWVVRLNNFHRGQKKYGVKKVKNVTNAL